jgi:Glycosyltransferase family 87
MQGIFKTIKIGNKISIPIPVIIWFALAIFGFSVELFRDSINNYHIFKGVFWHTYEQVNLYTAYPNEYFDVNHYGPFFSIIIAPFALLPNALGCTLWCLLNAAILYYSITKLPINDKGKLLILLLSALEMTTSLHNVQANPMVCSWLIFAFVLTEKKKDFWATAFIAAGFLMKIYGIVGLLFFVFSKKKFTFSWSFVFWLVIMFAAPMLISSPSFVIQSYQDWFYNIVAKNGENFSSIMQNMSVMGMLQRIFLIKQDLNLIVLAPAALLILIPLLRFSQYKSLLFRITYLCILLITIVIFSTGAESSTFVIAFVGIAISFVVFPQNKLIIALLVFALLLTSLSTTDLFPRYVRNNYIRPYSLKALPCFMVWVYLVLNLYTVNFNKLSFKNSYLEKDSSIS